MCVDKLYELWVKNTEDRELLFELESIRENEEEKNDRFYKYLDFGTAGLRGIMGAGTNRINIYTIGKATQGFADYLNDNFTSPRVAVSYDCRNKSEFFALFTAKVMAANGIKTYISKELRPTPFLSFAVKELKCSAGVMITASHNTAPYNGYKCYGADGSQITDNVSEKVYEYICKTDIFKDVKFMKLEKAEKAGMINFISDDLSEKYLNKVMACQINKVDFSNLKITYTPLNGAGKEFVCSALDKIGVKNLYMVPQQSEPSGDFLTCPYPNPEIEGAFELAVKVAKKNNCDIILATDPDSDRLGVCIKENNDYKLLTGNEIAVILFYYILESKKKLKILPKNPVVIKTMVSSKMINKIAEAENCAVKEVFTGFKNIASQILEMELCGKQDEYLFGFEESNGYLCGIYARDKDAVSAAVVFCEAAAYYKSLNLSLNDLLHNLKKKYGFYSEKTISKEFHGRSGEEKIKNIMYDLRKNPPQEIAGMKISKVKDYLENSYDMPEKKNVLRLIFCSGCEIIIRPSGTEPKIKIYLLMCADTKEELLRLTENFEKEFLKILSDQ